MGKQTSVKNIQEKGLKHSQYVQNQLSKISEERQKNLCISPQVIEQSDSDSVVLRVFAIIDEFIFQAMIRKPQLFVYMNAVQPRIFINALRGYWFGSFLYYMWKCKCFSGNYDLPVIYGNAKLPIGLAKMFQQFAPFMDTTTGSLYRFSVYSYNPNIYNDYPSVDMTGPTGDPRTALTAPFNDLNCPRTRFLIAAANAGGTMVDYGSGDGVQATSFGTPTIIDWVSYLQAGTNSVEFRLMQTLFDANILLDDVPTVAPDGSAYCLVYNTNIAAPFTAFSKPIAFITSSRYDDQNGTPDDVENMIYYSGLPVVRNYNRALSITGQDSKVSTLIAAYAYMTSFAQTWVPGKAKFLMLDAKELSGATKFSYTRKEVSFLRFALLVNNVMRTSSWSGTDTEVSNAMFCFSELAWSAFFQRTFPCAALNHSDFELYGIYGLYLPVSSCYYLSSMAIDGVRLPATIMRALAEVGPTVVEGHVQFPSYIQSMIPNCARASRVDGVNFDWSNALQDNGQWFPNPNTFIYGIKMPASTVVPITYPGRNNSFTYTTPAPVLRGSLSISTRFGINMALLQGIFAYFYVNKFPKEYSDDRFAPLPKCILGSASTMLTKVYGTFTDAVDPIWQNYFVKSYTQTNYTAAGSKICMPVDELVDAACFGLGNLYPPGYQDYYSPLYTDFGPALTDPIVTLQNALNSSSESQYQQFALALQHQKGGMTDAYTAVNTMLEEKKVELESSAVSAIKPSYSMMHDNITNLLRAGITFAQTELGRRVLNSLQRGAIQVITQGVNGQVQRVRQDYVAYRNSMNNLEL